MRAVDADAVAEIAKAAGFVISVEELKNAQAEMSEEELEALAGGMSPVAPAPATDPFGPVTGYSSPSCRN
jgi:hypothetical protein